jgi:predicted dehydrogenase
VNYNVRFYPAVLQLRRLVERGELGDIIHVNGSYMQDWLFKDTDYNWRLLPQEGGKLARGGRHRHALDGHRVVHPRREDQIGVRRPRHVPQDRRRPLGEVQTFAKADAKMKYATYPVQTEDLPACCCEFADGARGNLGVSQVAAGRKNCIRLEIYGSKKSAWWCSEEPEMLHFRQPRRRQRNRRAGHARVWRWRGGLHGLSARARRGFSGHVQDAFRSIYAAIAGAIAGATRAAHLCDGRGRAPRGRGVRGCHSQQPAPGLDEGLNAAARNRNPP